MLPPPARSIPFPYTTLFRSWAGFSCKKQLMWKRRRGSEVPARPFPPELLAEAKDRKSTRLNSSHLGISYAVFCLKKKMNKVTEFQEIVQIIENNYINKRNNI